MQFIQVAGQDILKERLVAMVEENRTGHALLFCEAPGCGALPLAIAMASYMLCESRRGGDSCGMCPTCNKTRKLIHPDLHFAMPVNSTKKVPSDKKPVSDHFIGEWREAVINNPYLTEQEWYNTIETENKSGIIGVYEASLILRKLSLQSFSGGPKFMMVWLPEKMNQEAANKLLKLIEEPPADTYILMVSHSPEKIIPTILSRCQIIRIPPIDREQLEGELMEEFDLSGAEAGFWAKLSGGSLSKARELIAGSALQQQMDILLARLLEGCANRDLAKTIAFWEEVATLRRDDQKIFLEYTLEFLRRALMVAEGLPEIANVPPSGTEQTAFWAQKFKPAFYGRALGIINGAMEDIGRNVNSRYIFADLSNRFFLSL